MKLTIEQQIEVLENVGVDHSNYFGLCRSISKSILEKHDILLAPSDIRKYIPLFTRVKASKFGAHKHSCYWWKTNLTFKSIPDPRRIEFLNWMISELKQQLIDANQQKS